MNVRVRHLNVDELYDAALRVDAVEVLTEGLITDAKPTARWAPGPLTMVEDPGTGERCAMSPVVLRACRTAALTALAARQLLAAGVVTASVIGSGTTAQLQLMIIARHVPDVSYIALCPLGDETDRPVEPRVIDQLDLAGIELTTTTRVDDAVFGANLVAFAGADRGELRLASLARGAVVVNASGCDLPDEVVEGIDQLYVDDLALVGTSTHRHFVRAHLAGTEDRTARQPGRRPGCRIEADLARVMTGQDAGRVNPDHLLLVELLGTRLVDLSLAGHIHRAARRHALPTKPPDSGPASFRSTKGAPRVDQR